MDDGPLFRTKTVGTVTLRDYQAKAVEALVGSRSYQDMGGRDLLVVPTGGGKTVLACAIIASLPTARVLFVAHRLELIDQTARQLERWGIHDIGVIRADDERTNPRARVQVASVQTLVRRTDVGDFDVCFIDECHRATAASYQRAVFDRYPQAHHIGLTATPSRLTGGALGQTYSRLVIGATYSQLIADGFVCEPEVYSTPAAVPSLEGVKTVGGDYHEGQLEAVMTGTRLVGSVADDLAEHRNGQRAVVFAVTVRHALALRDRLEGIGLRAGHVDGDTPLDERRATLAKLDAGELDVVTNVGVLTEGWDMPSVKVASVARPTKSLALWMQMAGRILRPWQGVTPVLLDHGDNVRRHGPPTSDWHWTLDDKPQRVAEKSPFKLCLKCFLYVRKWPCNACGYEPPPKPVEIHEDGHGLQRVGMTQGGKPVDERAAYDELVANARAQGFKPGFAAFRFKERFGRWPPWPWSQATKREFGNDPLWQERLAVREDMRARAEQREARAAVVPEASGGGDLESLNDVAEPAESAPSGGLGDWLEEMGIG